MRYFLGLDAGGTKTFCLVGDENGNILGFGRAGTGNYEYQGVEPAAIENRKAVNEALQAAGLSLADISGIGMGIAGADVPEDYTMLEREIYTPLFGDIPRNFRNDSMGALRGGTREPFGIVIACGTGCVCAGVNPGGQETRVGGLGEEFGDKCSGSQLGRDGVRDVWRARDGIIPPTLMTDMFIERAGASDLEDFFYRMYRQEVTYRDLEPSAKIVFDAAFAGDQAACDILESGGKYLGQMVNAIARKLNMTAMEYEVVMAGSVFKGKSPVLMNAFCTELHRVSPMAQPIMPRFEPVVGTLLMGMELVLKISDSVYANLTQSLRATEASSSIRLTGE